MNRNDPFDRPEEYLYECRECGAHTWTEDRIGRCADCGGEVWNIAVPRE